MKVGWNSSLVKTGWDTLAKTAPGTEICCFYVQKGEKWALQSKKYLSDYCSKDVKCMLLFFKLNYIKLPTNLITKGLSHLYLHINSVSLVAWWFAHLGKQTWIRMSSMQIMCLVFSSSRRFCLFIFVIIDKMIRYDKSYGTTSLVEILT